MNQEYSAAENSYKQAVFFGEDEEALTINYIQDIWINQGNYNRVIDYFQQKLHSSPKDYRYYYWIGRAFQLSLQIDTAQTWSKNGLVIAQQTIETNPEDAIALSFVGLFHSRLGNFPDGETAMNKAMQIDKNFRRNTVSQRRTLFYPARSARSIFCIGKGNEPEIRLCRIAESRLIFHCARTWISPRSNEKDRW